MQCGNFSSAVNRCCTAVEMYLGDRFMLVIISLKYETTAGGGEGGWLIYMRPQNDQGYGAK